MDEATKQTLQELAENLDSGRITTLRVRFKDPRRLRQALTRYTDTVWLFPFGAEPSLDHPIQVFRNGIAVWMGDEAKVHIIGKKHPTPVLILNPPTRDGDVIQATYVAIGGHYG